MDRATEAERFRKIVLQTVIAVLIACALLVITFLWLFGKLLS